jgi:CRISPR-associated endonuclease/helicase Cas3
LPGRLRCGAGYDVLEPKMLNNGDKARRLGRSDEIILSEETNKAFYAHSKEGIDKREWQRLIDHLNNTAALASDMGSDAGISDLARTVGMLHDLGKYSREFQQRLEGKKIRVDHATAGAKELTQRFKGKPQEPLTTLLAYCISGHHTGLLDYGDSSDLPGDGTLMARLKTGVCDYSAYKTELDLTTLQFPRQLHICPMKGQMGFSLAFLTRMIYSTLVDADFQETEEYMQGKKPRGEHASIEVLCKALMPTCINLTIPKTTSTASVPKRSKLASRKQHRNRVFSRSPFPPAAARRWHRWLLRSIMLPGMG